VKQETSPIEGQHRVLAVGFLHEIAFEIFGGGDVVQREELKDLMLSEGWINVTKSAEEAIVEDISLLCSNKFEDLTEDVRYPSQEEGEGLPRCPEICRAVRGKSEQGRDCPSRQSFECLKWK
jgi:hypothetical protein